MSNFFVAIDVEGRVWCDDEGFKSCIDKGITTNKEVLAIPMIIECYQHGCISILVDQHKRCWLHTAKNYNQSFGVDPDYCYPLLLDISEPVVSVDIKISVWLVGQSGIIYESSVETEYGRITELDDSIKERAAAIDRGILFSVLIDDISNLFICTNKSTHKLAERIKKAICPFDFSVRGLTTVAMVNYGGHVYVADSDEKVLFQVENLPFIIDIMDDPHTNGFIVIDSEYNVYRVKYHDNNSQKILPKVTKLLTKIKFRSVLFKLNMMYFVNENNETYVVKREPNIMTNLDTCEKNEIFAGVKMETLVKNFSDRFMHTKACRAK